MERPEYDCPGVRFDYGRDSQICFLTEHPSKRSAQSADPHYDNRTVRIHRTSKIQYPGYGEQHYEVEQARQQSPEESPLPDPFSGGQASDKACRKINGEHHDIYLPLFQPQLIKSEGQSCQQKA